MHKFCDCVCVVCAKFPLKAAHILHSLWPLLGKCPEQVALSAQLATLNSQLSTLNSQPSALNSQLPTLSSQLSTVKFHSQLLLLCRDLFSNTRGFSIFFFTKTSLQNSTCSKRFSGRKSCLFNSRFFVVLLCSVNSFCSHILRHFLLHVYLSARSSIRIE